METNYDSSADTLNHILKIQELLHRVVKEFLDRADWHDRSKLLNPEKEVFDRIIPKLKKLEYGSDEYKVALSEMGEALNHHYKSNPGHHPEAHANGIDDMNLFDLIEMFIDWKAASERHNTGSIIKSIEINSSRFSMSEQLKKIFENTATYCGWNKPAKVWIERKLDEEPLTDNQEKELEFILCDFGFTIKTNFKPISEREANDVNHLKYNMLINGSHFFQYYIWDEKENTISISQKKIDHLLNKLKSLNFINDDHIAVQYDFSDIYWQKRTFDQRFIRTEYQ